MDKTDEKFLHDSFFFFASSSPTASEIGRSPPKEPSRSVAASDQFFLPLMENNVN